MVRPPCQTCGINPRYKNRGNCYDCQMKKDKFRLQYKNNIEAYKKARTSYVLFNRDKVNSRNMARRAYPKRQKCEMDGCFELGERHHSDHNKPLEFRWLCKRHHEEEHHAKSQ